jgi:murein DD-endopeptidase MepM/ murein hydrolase activator NlpD
MDVQTKNWPGKSHAVVVKHDHFVAVYGEVIETNVENEGEERPLQKGEEVKKGQVIAKVETKMLHFEMYSDTKSLAVVNPGKEPAKGYKNVPDASYKRRADLMDPTSHLQMWSKSLPKPE